MNCRRKRTYHPFAVLSRVPLDVEDTHQETTDREDAERVVSRLRIDFASKGSIPCDSATYVRRY